MIAARFTLKLLGTTYFNAGAEVVVALSRAVEVFEREGRSDYELAALLFPMMKLAYYSPHFRLLLKYGERTLSIGLRITGLTLAGRLRPVLGSKLGLAAGLIVGAIGFAKQRRRGVGYDLRRRSRWFAASSRRSRRRRPLASTQWPSGARKKS